MFNIDEFECYQTSPKYYRKIALAKGGMIMKKLIICISIISFMLLFCPIALDVGKKLLIPMSFSGSIASILILTSYALYAINYVSWPTNITLMIILCTLSIRKKKHIVKIFIFAFFNIGIAILYIFLASNMRAVVV